MYRVEGEVLYSASDLVNFLDCEHITTLDLLDLETPLPKSEDDDEARLVQAKGQLHEAAYLQHLKAKHVDLAEVDAGSDLVAGLRATQQAMQAGAEVIYQAALRDGNLIGHADFLRRVSRPSRLGGYSYEVIDTKLARSAKGKFIIQLAFYSELLAKVQGVAPSMMHIVLGDGTEQSFRVADYARYFDGLRARFLRRVEQGSGGAATYPDPCARCALCRWRELCEARRIDDDHLCQVAGISRLQAKRLQAAGVSTLTALAQLPPPAKLPRLAPETLAKLRLQAALQLKARQDGGRHLELVPATDDDGRARGFARLPRPDPGDLFFDMEGDPYEDGGLEYLFGFYHLEGGKGRHTAFWAHSREEEKRAFEAAIDFISDRLRKHPSAHVYHYAHYEPTALKRLMSLHATREADMDGLLRAEKFVDLYKVVRESLRISEPSYSLKDVERFYLKEERAGDVRSAGASIVQYERWKETGDSAILEEIARYNRDDVHSTWALREWLLKLRPSALPWARNGQGAGDEAARKSSATVTEFEMRLEIYRGKLLDGLPADRMQWGADEHLRELTFHLLAFHRRAAKPEWWGMFDRQDRPAEELMDDPECLGGLRRDPDNPPYKDGRSIVYTYLYPEQETKLKDDDDAVVTASLIPVSKLKFDIASKRVNFRVSGKSDPLPDRISLGPTKPVNATALEAAVWRFADSIIAGEDRYRAVVALLKRELPCLRDRWRGDAIVEEAAPLLPQAMDAALRLDRSYLFIQGPPGAGKTYTGAHVIVGLLKAGRRVGVTSNSHKAINNLLSKVVEVAAEQGLRFSGVKKSTANRPETFFEGSLIENETNNDEVVDSNALLLAGTAWLFADERLDEALDYLFVDEAGQVSLANLVAMGAAARNIVLLGDQMQLGQPIQGVHPGRSGESVLEYLLDGIATIPPERGIFLKTTWRMHADVCRFISDAVYDGRLEPEPANNVQRLLLTPDAHAALCATGVRFLPIEHDGCSQTSEEEAELARALYDSLLAQRYRDKRGIEHAMTLDNILVVAPYNAQVNLLKRVLPEGARVGTVDKFQGQEAEVVVVSMTTSSGDYLPRHVEFLYSKNRLNVAISRAKCLAIVIASPALLTIRCETPEQMALVNTLCWVAGMRVDVPCQTVDTQ